MKTVKKIVSATILTVLFSMLLTGAIAQKPGKGATTDKVYKEQAPPPDAPPPPPPPATDKPEVPPPPPPPSAERRGARAPMQLDLPDLTREQHDKIKQVGLENMKKMTPLRNQLREKKARLQTVMGTEPFDGKTADQVADEMGKIHAEILKTMIRHDQALRGLLTDEQKIVFDSHPKPFLRGEQQN